MNEAQTYILDHIKELGDYDFLPCDTLKEMVLKLSALDEEYMEQAGVNAGGEYDDNDALEYLAKALKAAYPDYEMYMHRLCEDYLDYNEEYLDSIGAIEWE